ncbi:TIGR03915 family putative DNA repair protein [Sphingobacterium lactis]|uniref:TIGR03915 family putative DNA repair protein n=1 Tax=Sphingobacterium lactis TaxID=797291 RepID=UPI003EC4CE1B
MYYLFDGSFHGYLCCVFESFERKEFDAEPITSAMQRPSIFYSSREIATDNQKADRILQALEKKIGKKDIVLFYHNFLADDAAAWLNGFQLLVALFQQQNVEVRNYGDPKVLLMHQTIKKVSRERHRMKAFVRFVKSADQIYTALVDPDFNVLPLVTRFFKDRFADQSWLIYDLRRNYGFFYDRKSVNEVTNAIEGDVQDPYAFEVDLDPRELEFQHLWQTYFKSTNIEARKNIKLHLRHVPKRYWKYLVEKRSASV